MQAKQTSSPRSWLDRFVTLRNIEHLRIHHRGGKNGYFTNYVHCVLERDSGEQGHWFAMLASPEYLPKGLTYSPVIDGFQAAFAPELLQGNDGEIPGSFHTIDVRETSGAPLLKTVQGEERAAPERLLTLLSAYLTSKTGCRTFSESRRVNCGYNTFSSTAMGNKHRRARRHG